MNMYLLFIHHAQLRKGVGGVQYTPTVLVVYYADSSKMIAKYEGGGEIMAAVQR